MSDKKKNEFNENKLNSDNSEIKKEIDELAEKEIDKLKECQKLAEDFKNQLLRVNADFQNFKKRIEKEKAEWIEFSQATVIKAFLPFLDDLERAIETSKKEAKKEDFAWLHGFEIIKKKLKKVFEDLGVKEIDCTKNFDPNYHEALMQVDSKDYKSGQIVQVLNKGYTFKGKVLRHAKVSVAK